jgi:far upstream element-binding protein
MSEAETAPEAPKRERQEEEDTETQEPPSKKLAKIPDEEEGAVGESAAPANGEITETPTAAEGTPNAEEKSEPADEAPKEAVAPALTPVPTPAPVEGLPPGLPTTDAKPVQVAALDDTVEENGEVSAVYVGRVIGKGGEMIRDLQARAGCRIDVDQNVPPGQPRLITYRGTRKTIDFAKQLVHLLCQENVNEADLPLGEAKREFLVVPAGSVGKIIGRGGEMIRELQSRSQAKIQVDHKGVSGLDASEKQVTMTGTELSVVKAKEMVLFLVANPMMDAMQSLTMLVDDKIQRGGVWGSGPPYPNLPDNGQNMAPNSGGGGGGGGYGQSYGGGGGGGYGQSYGGGPSSYQQPQAPSYGGGGQETEIFYAAKHFMGRIIGSKGVTINDLQKRSGCDIQIDQNVPPGRDCEISLRGTRQAIEMAKNMLREVIETGPNHPYAGGHGGGGGGQSYGGYQQGGYHQQQQPSYGYQGQGGYQQQQPQYGQGSYGQNPGYGGAPQAQPYQQAQYQQSQSQAGYGAPPPVAPPASEWKSAAAPDGQTYYYNVATGETTWQKPPGMP